MLAKIMIDKRLLAEARRVGGHRTNDATVTEALREYIRIRKQMKIVDLFGTIDFDPNYDSKKQRNRR
ncbi:MAG TPA: type II toxin-antitoxin system VapB family antitoxin [Thermoanaerobaculia bacterium]|jgi:hypothetical protein|nr:type II toxin-antitoxin system VapB family antitoxin [Thermoanaerobaculia bacterium]